MNQILYKEIAKAVAGSGGSFKMQLGKSDARVLIPVVNRGIDAHLEACSIEGRDKYVQKGHKLHCEVSAESMPGLLRRLSEAGTEEADALARSILDSLKIKLDDGGFSVVKERVKNTDYPEDDEDVRYEHLTPSEFAAGWGSDKYPHTMFYNYSEEQNDPKFLREFLPVIDQTIASIKNDSGREKDVEDLEEFKVDVEAQLAELGEADGDPDAEDTD